METKCTPGSDISSVSLVVCRGTWPWDRKLGHDAEVVARPHAVYRLVEEALAGGDLERGTMVAAAGLRTPAPHHHRGHPSRALQLSLSARNSSHVRRPTACSGARLAPARNTRAALPGSRPARSADAAEWPAGTRGAGRPRRTPAAHPCRAPDRPARGA